MNGAAQIIQVLKQQRIDALFTLCGGHISPILVEAKKAGIRVIDVRHEANAAFAADAYSRLTGKVGVVAVTAGPGVSNTITAVKNAQLAQSPLLLLGGATATLLRGRGSLQDIDQISLIEAHVKWAGRPNAVSEIFPAIHQALQVAQSGVPGPVFVEVAVDLLYEESVVREWYVAKTDRPNPTLPEKLMAWYIKGHLAKVFAGRLPDFTKNISARIPSFRKGDVQRAAKWLQNSEKPVLIIGSQAMLNPVLSGELVNAIESLKIPTFCSGMARGLLGKNHPLQLRHKRTQALKEADVVILCGVPCDFRLDYGSPLRRAKVISINRSSDDLFQNRRPDLAILADPHQTLCAIAAQKPEITYGDWLEKLQERNQKRDAEILEMSKEEVQGGVNPLQFFIEMEKVLDGNSILVGDGGDFVASASYIVQPPKPYSWLDPGVFGTLGVGAGFAMAASLVHPDNQVWLIYGDGASGFSLMELDTCVRHQIPIIAVIGNDGGWTQIARDQVVILEDDVGTVLTQMDYHIVAQGCGAHGILVKDMDEVPKSLQEAIEVSKTGKPVVINLLIGTTDFRKGSISM